MLVKPANSTTPGGLLTDQTPTGQVSPRSWPSTPSAAESPRPVLVRQPGSERGPAHHALPRPACGRCRRVCPRVHMRVQQPATETTFAQRGRRPRSVLVDGPGAPPITRRWASTADGPRPAGAAAEFRTWACPPFDPRPALRAIGARVPSCPRVGAAASCRGGPCSHPTLKPARGSWPARVDATQHVLVERAGRAADHTVLAQHGGWPRPLLVWRPGSERGPAHHAAQDQPCGRSGRRLSGARGVERSGASARLRSRGLVPAR